MAEDGRPGIRGRVAGPRQVRLGKQTTSGTLLPFAPDDSTNRGTWHSTEAPSKAAEHLRAGLPTLPEQTTPRPTDQSEAALATLPEKHVARCPREKLQTLYPPLSLFSITCGHIFGRGGNLPFVIPGGPCRAASFPAPEEGSRFPASETSKRVSILHFI